MKEIITMIILTGLFFLSFVVTLILSLKKKNKKLKFASIVLLILFCGMTVWTGMKFVSKSYSKVTEIFKPRTGDEIYDALFDIRKTDCVNILSYQDQVIPKIDYAIWLHFETCPAELTRILNRHKFSADKLSTDKWDGKIPYGETLEWFNPTTLGDSIVVYEYSTDNSRNIQTLWTNLDSTEVFIRDILD